jgi:hypothetical protein
MQDLLHVWYFLFIEFPAPAESEWRIQIYGHIGTYWMIPTNHYASRILPERPKLPIRSRP